MVTVTTGNGYMSRSSDDRLPEMPFKPFNVQLMCALYTLFLSDLLGRHFSYVSHQTYENVDVKVINNGTHLNVDT